MMYGTSVSYIRSAAPHGRSRLVPIHRHDVLALIAGRIRRGKAAGKGVAKLSTSCPCLGAASQSTSAAYKTHRTRTGERPTPSLQKMNKMLQEAQISSWVFDGVHSILNGISTIAANVPQRLTEEISRMVKKGGDDDEKPKKDRSKMQVVIPLSEEPAGKDVPKKRPPGTGKSVSERTPKDPQSFEKAMAETYSSVTSYYDTSASQPAVSPTPVDESTPAAPSVPFQSHTESGVQVYDLEEKIIPAQLKPKPKPQAARVSWGIFKYFPFPSLQFSFSAAAETVKKAKQPLIKKEFVTRSALETRTRSLVMGLKAATTVSSKMRRMQELSKHLREHPVSRLLATKEKAVPTLLRILDMKKDVELQEQARECLALLGYMFPPKAHGIRILTLDGGGTRGLVSIECLKKLEAVTGKKVFEMFDFVCGVSTGALIGVLTCLFRCELSEVERVYIECSKEMFTRSRVIGTSALFWNQAFYSSEQWENILQLELGHRPLIEFARDPGTPKVCAVSCLVNTPHMKHFMFRNYNLPPESYSKYPGSCTNQIWEAIRATTAAPGYYEDFILNNYVHVDGGVMVNNPTALAIHEARLLWPGETLQCVVSLGTGRYEPVKDVAKIRGLTLREKISKVVDSATDTEGVHNVMTDLLPPSTYFRFNPYVSEELQLDEIRVDKLDLMQRDAQMYLRKNETKLKKAAASLNRNRLPHQHALDWLKAKADKWGY